MCREQAGILILMLQSPRSMPHAFYTMESACAATALLTHSKYMLKDIQLTKSKGKLPYLQHQSENRVSHEIILNISTVHYTTTNTQADK